MYFRTGRATTVCPSKDSTHYSTHPTPGEWGGKVSKQAGAEIGREMSQNGKEYKDLRKRKNPAQVAGFQLRLEGFEPPTYGSVGRHVNKPQLLIVCDIAPISLCAARSYFTNEFGQIALVCPAVSVDKGTFM